MVNIPIRLLNLNDSGFHLLVEVVVFNRPFVAVLDTGASHTVFDKETVEQYLSEDIQLLDTDLKSTGLGTNTMQSFSLTVPDLQVGAEADQSLHLKNYGVAVLDLSSINYAYRQLDLQPVIGVIGGDILTAYGGIINYRKLKLSLRERKYRSKAGQSAS